MAQTLWVAWGMRKAAQAAFLTINTGEPYGIAKRPLALTKQDYTWLNGAEGKINLSTGNISVMILSFESLRVHFRPLGRNACRGWLRE